MPHERSAHQQDITHLSVRICYLVRSTVALEGGFFLIFKNWVTAKGKSGSFSYSWENKIKRWQTREHLRLKVHVVYITCEPINKKS